jgi:hypothetical protein
VGEALRCAQAPALSGRVEKQILGFAKDDRKKSKSSGPKRRLMPARLEQARGVLVCSFVVEEPALAVHAAAISGERAVGPDDAMAGNDYADGVGAIRGADGADRIRLADSPGEFAVRDGGAAGDVAESAPDGALKVGAGGFYGDVVDGVEVAGEVAGEGAGETVRVARGAEFDSCVTTPRTMTFPWGPRRVVAGEDRLEVAIIFSEESSAEIAFVVGDDLQVADGSGEVIEVEVQGTRWDLESRHCSQDHFASNHDERQWQSSMEGRFLPNS